MGSGVRVGDLGSGGRVGLGKLGFTKSQGSGLVGCLVGNLVVWLVASDLIWMINLS